MKKTAGKNPRYIRPPNVLKKKVGGGGINEILIERAQQQIEIANYDFHIYAVELLEKLSEKLKDAQKEKSIDPLIPPMMALKASGGMFQYQLLSDVADIGLQFLENIENINADSIAVLKAHENTLTIILESQLRGDGGDTGYELVKELDRACKRYFDKHSQKQV